MVFMGENEESNCFKSGETETEIIVDAYVYTMYGFHNSTDTLKFGTEKQAINKTFLFFIRF